MLVFGKFRVSLQRTIALGFACIILVGALLLTLPIANKDGESPGFVNSLFTATSATCVTGLVVLDTYTQFTLFGQTVILAMIQVGGLGFISMTIFFLMIMGKKVNLKERSLLMEASSAFHIGGAVRFAKRVLTGTAVFELAGAILLSLRFVPLMGTAKGIWFGVFHSISAFCNAGFDLMGVSNPFISLEEYRADPLVVLTVLVLIVFGGIGFIVWEDLIKHNFRIKHCTLHTKIVLTATAVLIAGGTLLFYLIESNHAFSGMPAGERFLSALFQAVTPRTAGFNTVSQTELSGGGNLLTMLLMFIGASPGSTGGGVKTSTLTVILLTMLAYARNRHDINAFGRRLDDGVVRRAFCSVGVYLLIMLAGAFTLLISQDLPVTDVFFEAFSAIGTVGLSTGITRELNVVSRIAVMVLIFSGRVGSLTLAMALAERKPPAAIRNPQEKIAIG